MPMTTVAVPLLRQRMIEEMSVLLRIIRYVRHATTSSVVALRSPERALSVAGLGVVLRRSWNETLRG
jgi:hypothetical protein